MGYSADLTKTVLIQETVPGSAVTGLAKFIGTYYLTPNLPTFKNASYKESESKADGRFDFSWEVDASKVRPHAGSAEDRSIPMRLSIAADGVRVTFPDYAARNDPVGAEITSRYADDIEATVTNFLNYSKKTSLHFVFSLGKDEKMEAPPQATGSVRRTVLKKLFAGNTVNLYLLLIAVSFVLVFILGYYSVVVLLAIQAFFLFFSDRLVMGAGNVRPTREQPRVTIVTVLSTPQILRSLSRQGRQVLPKIRNELEVILAADAAQGIDPKAAIQKVLVQDGVECSIEDIEVTTRNPYAMVEEVSGRFHLPVPKVTVVNTPMDNASATGVSPGRSSITITAGALEDLNDSELESVIGHELGHVKGRDPVILFGVTSVMYIGGLLLWLPLIIYLGFFYFILAFGVIYLVGKFLETRADTESVIVLGSPNVLASALSRIGFGQLYYERYSPRMRFLDWLRFDPHPPIYFRVRRLSQMAVRGVVGGNTLIVSIRDCISGFFRALVGLD